MTDTQRRVRSPKFPFIDLKVSIERADAFYQSEKRNSASVPVAMQVWGYKDESSGGFQTISTLKEFGLMEDSGSKDARRVKLTDRALRILLDKRENSPERDQLIKEAALLPRTYSALWQYYQGELPSDSNLRHYLMFDYETPFNENSVDSFVENFRSTLKLAKLTASDTISSASEDKAEYENQQEPKMPEVQNNQPPPKPIPPPLATNSTTRQDIFSLAEGPVVIQWPAALSEASYEDLGDWLDILKRKIGRSVVRTGDDVKTEKEG